MKTTIKNIGTFLAAVLAVGLFASCDKIDYPERFQGTEGTPTVHYIRYAGSDSPDVFITGAYYDEVICIVGENLKSVRELYFNDVKATLNTSFITDNTLLCNVTKTLPTVKTDKIYLVNYSGETVSYDFKTLAPAPTVSSMSYEYAPEGTSVTLYGNYFIQDADTPLTVSFTGADPVTEFESLEMTALTFKMPKAVEGTVTVTTASGSGTSAFHYLESRGLLFDFDGVSPLGNHGWHAQTIATDANAITGNYLQLGDGSAKLAGDGSDWNDTNFHFEYWAGNWADPENYSDPAGVRIRDRVDVSNYSNMALKFDICIPAENPWTGCPMQIYFANGSLISYGNAGAVDIYGTTLAGCNNTYFHDEAISLPRYIYKPWAASGSFDTGGKWITVTMPIADFNKFWDESDAKSNITPDSFDAFEIFCAAGKGDGTECAPIIKIDNIRLVPNK